MSNALTVFSNPADFETSQRMAKALCAASLFPAHLRGNLADALIVLEMAQRLGTSPLLVAQQLYVVHGKPAWSSQYCIAAVNASGRYDTLKFEITGEGDARQCVAWARDNKGERIEGPPVSIAMAKAEGWYDRRDKNGKLISKWPTMSELLLRYRSATFFARLYCPDLLMGMRTQDEQEDIGAGVIVERPRATPEPQPEVIEAVAEPVVPQAELVRTNVERLLKELHISKARVVAKLGIDWQDIGGAEMVNLNEVLGRIKFGEIKAEDYFPYVAKRTPAEQRAHEESVIDESINDMGE